MNYGDQLEIELHCSYIYHSFIFFLNKKREKKRLEKAGDKMKKKEKFPVEKRKEIGKNLKRKNSSVVNKSVWYGCIIVYSFPMVNLLWGTFLFCVLRE